MTDIKQADAMMRMAHRDVTALHGMHDAVVFADEIFGFHVQQAVKKVSKPGCAHWDSPTRSPTTSTVYWSCSKMQGLKLRPFGGRMNLHFMHSKRAMKKAFQRLTKR